MAGERTTLTDAQIASRTNHYLEKIGKGKPKTKGTKNNPYKGKEIADLLKNRSKKKAAPKTNAEAIAQLNEQAKAEAPKAEAKAHKPLTNAQAHQIQHNIPQEQADKLNKLKAELEAKENAAVKPETKVEAKPNAEAKVEAPTTEAKPKAEPKTWKKYFAEHGKDFSTEKSGVVEADKRAAEAIAKNNAAKEALKAEALNNAEKINKSFKTTNINVDKQLGIGRNYDVPQSYADDYAKLMDEKYGKVDTKSNKPLTNAEAHQIQNNIPQEQADKLNKLKAELEAKEKAETKFADKPEVKNNAKAENKAAEKPKTEKGGNAEQNKKADGVKPEQNGKGKAPIDPSDVNKGGKSNAKKAPKTGGFFSKIGKFFKGKGGKIALAGAAIAGLAFLLSKCGGGKKDEEVVPPAPVNPTPEPTPTPETSIYDVEKEEGQMPKAYTIKYGDYPVGIIADTYGVTYGTPEFKEIQKAVYEASGYERNTNLKVGDKFTLPDVTIGETTYTANPDADVRKGKVVNNGLKLGRTKEVVKAGDNFYVIYSENGQRVAGEPAYESEEAARARIGELEAADEEVQEAA